MVYGLDDDSVLRLQQERQVKELYQACCSSGHELLLEILPPADTVVDDDTCASVLARLYNLDIRPDWWKLPMMSRAAWRKVSDLISRRAPHCRGVVILGQDAPASALRAGFNACAGFDICKGFTIGRTIFAKPGRQWLAGEIDDEALVESVARNYVELIDHWRNRKASQR